MSNYLLLAAEPATVVFLVGLVISIALGVTAAVLAAKQKVRREPGQPPPTTVLQGGIIPVVLGRRRIAPLVAAVGNRAVFSSRRGSGKSKGPREYTFSESAWHLLCVGPAYKLHRIWIDGAIAWEGPIDSDTTPSGSQIPGFPGFIYWGAEDQDFSDLAEVHNLVNSIQLETGNPFVPVTSGFGLVCSVLLKTIALGPQPIWPQIEYEVECRLLDEFALGLIPGHDFDGGDGAVASAANEAADKFWKKGGACVFNAGFPATWWITMLVKLPFQNVSPTTNGNGVWWAVRRTGVGQSIKIGTMNGTHIQVAVSATVNVTAQLVRAWDADPVRVIAVFRVVAGTTFVDLYTNESPAGVTASGAVAWGANPAETYIGSYAFFGADVGFNTWVESFPYAGLGGALTGDGIIGPIHLFFGTEPDSDQRDRIYAGEDPAVIGSENGCTLEEHHPMDEENGGDDVIGTVGVMNVMGSPTYSPIQEPTDLWIEDGDSEGVNPAQAWHQIAVAPFPYGAGGQALGADEDHLDEATLLDWAEEAVDEVLPANLFAGNGDLASETLATLQQDHGVLMAHRSDTGKIVAQRIRDAAPIVVPEAVNEGPLPEVERPLLDVRFDRVMFSYPDKNRAYKDTVITIDEDGQASLLDVQRTERSPIFTATDYATARKLAERRSQEDLPGNVGVELQLGRNAYLLWPGRVLDISAIDPEIPARLRILAVELEHLTSTVKVNCVADNYGATATGYEGEGAGIPSAPAEEAVEDVAATFLELPTVLLPDRITRIVILRVRGSVGIVGANVYLSPDGATYSFNEDVPDAAAGGTLDTAIAADTLDEIDQGPTITPNGPDIGTVLDLSTDLASWRAGAQLLVIGGEIMTLQKATAIDADTYRLDGIQRARFGTTKAAHAMGAQVYIVQRAELTALDDALLTPGQDLFVKPQPHLLVAEVDLGDVNAINDTIRGNGVVPPAPTSLRAIAPTLGVPRYPAGGDPATRWCHTSNDIPGTGYGLCNYGTPVGVSPVYGTFVIEVYRTSDDELVRTEDVGTDTEWTYDNADLIADLGGEVAFYLEIRNVNGGFRSEPATIHWTPE